MEINNPSMPVRSEPATAMPPAWPTPPQRSMATAPAATPPLDASQGAADPRVSQQALRATVRIQVHETSAQSVATGTIIDVHGQEALIVTCGHVFRESQGKGKIQVDLFVDTAPRTVNGTLISCDLERDIALVAVSPGTAIQPARVAPPAFQFQRGQPVFSIGCDKGANPSVRSSAITSIDRYVGTPNLEVAGMPVDGRSGGGLFRRKDS